MTAEHQIKLGIFVRTRSVPWLRKLPCLHDTHFFSLVPCGGLEYLLSFSKSLLTPSAFPPPQPHSHLVLETKKQHKKPSTKTTSPASLRPNIPEPRELGDNRLPMSEFCPYSTSCRLLSSLPRNSSPRFRGPWVEDDERLSEWSPIPRAVAT